MYEHRLKNVYYIRIRIFQMKNEHLQALSYTTILKPQLTF